jgi:hypothetical protein
MAVIVTLMAGYAWFFVRANQPYDTFDNLTWCQSRYRTAKTATDTAMVDAQSADGGRRTQQTLRCGVLRRAGKI